MPNDTPPLRGPRGEPSADADRPPLDRRTRDGAAGQGDVLGGLGAGAGDRRGPDPSSADTAPPDVGGPEERED